MISWTLLHSLARHQTQLGQLSNSALQSPTALPEPELINAPSLIGSELSVLLQNMVIAYPRPKQRAQQG